jgi:uncharacterized protein (DUF1684 family)
MRILSIFFFLSLLSWNLFSQNDHKREVISFQNELNSHYSDTAKSPLTDTDLLLFKGLDFFPINEKYKVKADFYKVFNPLHVTLKTTTDRAPEYKIYATVEFTLEGKFCKLNVYQSESLSDNNEYKDYLFLPFTDNTNGVSSYGSGRYVDLRIPEGDEIIIDFNKAYNPYCAYNHKYSCVVPPPDNHIDSKIEAGVSFQKKEN